MSYVETIRETKKIIVSTEFFSYKRNVLKINELERNLKKIQYFSKKFVFLVTINFAKNK